MAEPTPRTARRTRLLEWAHLHADHDTTASDILAELSVDAAEETVRRETAAGAGLREALDGKRGYQDSIGRWVRDPIGIVVLWSDVEAALASAPATLDVERLLRSASFMSAIESVFAAPGDDAFKASPVLGYYGADVRDFVEMVAAAYEKQP